MGEAHTALAFDRRVKSVAVQRRIAALRLRILVLGLVVGLPCLASTLAKAPPLLVWNASASSPRGLYRVFPEMGARRGDWAIARLPTSLRALAAQRHYLPIGVPLVKRVAAGRGNRVCALGDRLTLDGRLLAVRRTWDGKGRPLPRWSGCRTLGAGEVLLLGDSPWSFDGRYFGVTRAADVIGRAELWWEA